MRTIILLILLGVSTIVNCQKFEDFGLNPEVIRIEGSDFKELNYSENTNCLYFYGQVDDFEKKGINCYNLNTRDLTVPLEGDFEAFKISKDGSILYAFSAFDNPIPKTMFVYNLNNFEELNRFQIGDHFFQYFDISPTNPNLIAVTVNTANNKGELILFEHGIKLPSTFILNDRYDPHFLPIGNKIVVSAKKFSGIEVPEFILNYDQSGVVPIDTSYVLNNANSRIVLDSGLVYMNQTIFDLTSDNPDFIGNFDPTDNNQVIINKGTNEFYVLSEIAFSSADSRFRIYDNKSFNLKQSGSIDFNQIEPSLPKPRISTFRKSDFIQLKDGLNFSYISRIGVSTYVLSILYEQCSEKIKAPTLGVENIQLGCGGPVSVKPFSDYDYFINSEGYRVTDFEFKTSGVYKFRIVDENNCLSELSDAVIIHFGSKPPEPKRLFAFNNNNLDLVQKCKDGDIVYRTESIKGKDVTNIVWADGYIGRDHFRSSKSDSSMYYQYINEYGCLSDTSNVIEVEVINEPAPSQPIIYSDQISFDICNRPLNLFYKDEYEEYLSWKPMSRQENDFNFSTSNEWHVKTFEFGLYFFIGKTENGCWSKTTNIEVRKSEGTSDVPIIKRYDNIIGPSEDSPAIGSEFIWYRGAERIPDSNSMTTIPFTSGIYRMRTKIGQCWTDFSNNIEIE